MSHQDGTKSQRHGSTYATAASKTPYRGDHGMKMAPHATTILSHTEVLAVTPTPSRIPKRSLASNTDLSQRQLKRSRHNSNTNTMTPKDNHDMQPPWPNASSSYSSVHDSTTSSNVRRDDDSSLGTLAIRFFNLLKSYGDNELDLNEAVQSLGVQKRRIYDVTCVMEGCGMIEKRNKNQVANCCKESQSEALQKKEIQDEIDYVKEEEKVLDSYIESLQKIVKQYTCTESSAMTSNLFVTKSEIASMKNYINDTVLAIRAPPKTSVYVPHPDQTKKPGMRKFQIQMMCPDKNSVYIHEVKCGSRMGKETSRNLAATQMSQRPAVGRQPHINSGHIMHPRELDAPKYPNSMPIPNCSRNVWDKNRGNSYPIQEQRKVVRNYSGLHNQDSLSHSTVLSNTSTTSGSNGLIAPKSHMHPPQLPSTDSLSKRSHYMRPPSQSNIEGANGSAVATFPLKRKHEWKKSSQTNITLRPAPRSIKIEGHLGTDSYIGRKSNNLKPVPPPSITNCDENELPLLTHSARGKFSIDSAKSSISCEILSPGSSKKPMELSQCKEGFSSKISTDTVMCGRSPNTRNYELLNAPLDSPLLSSPRPFRHSRTSDGYALNSCSLLSTATYYLLFLPRWKITQVTKQHPKTTSPSHQCIGRHECFRTKSADNFYCTL